MEAPSVIPRGSPPVERISDLAGASLVSKRQQGHHLQRGGKWPSPPASPMGVLAVAVKQGGPPGLVEDPSIARPGAVVLYGEARENVCCPAGCSVRR